MIQNSNLSISNIKQAVQLVDRTDTDPQGGEIKGLFGIHVLPANLPTKKFDFKGKPVLYAVFRGTYDEYSLWRRDTKIAAPGKQQFNSMAENIKQKIVTVLEEFKDMLKQRGRGEDAIIVCATGHSLGGADAERYTAEFTELLAQEKLAFIKVDELHTVGFNPPGIDFDIAKNFLDNAPKPGCKGTQIFVSDIKVEGDIVQKGGQCHIGFPGSLSKEEYPHNVHPITIKSKVPVGKAVHTSNLLPKRDLGDPETKNEIDREHYGELAKTPPSSSPNSPENSPSTKWRLQPEFAKIEEVRTIYEPLRKLASAVSDILQTWARVLNSKGVPTWCELGKAVVCRQDGSCYMLKRSLSA